MADWSDPTVLSLYTDFVSEAKERDVDSLTLAVVTPTNPPTGAIQFDRAAGKLKEYDGAIWVDKLIGLSGGGTGAATAAGARTALGLGTMATQGAGAVAITGGTLAGITAFALTGNMTFTADNVSNIGTNLSRPAIAYIRSALVIPVGTDKFTLV